jgi:predicted transcriptional regulator
MPEPEGSLTPIQYEIMDAVWRQEKTGATVGEIWQTIAAQREVARTTVLNLVDRLEKRAWLKRRKRRGVYRYTASVAREQAASLLAAEFVDNFFGGSAANLVLSLLGSERFDAADIERLQRLIEAADEDDAKGNSR